MSIDSLLNQTEKHAKSLYYNPDFIGGFGLFTFVLFFQLNTVVAYIGLFLTIFAFAFQAKEWLPLLKREPVVWLFVAIILYLIAYTVWAIFEFPETAKAQWKALVNWIHWLLFIPVSWQIFVQAKYLNYIFLTLAAGVLVRILIHFNWSDVENILQWERTGFGLIETVFAPIAGTTALGFLLLAPRLVAATANSSKWFGFVKTGFVLISLAILLESLILSQTRSAWLAAAIVYPVALFARYKGSHVSHISLSLKKIGLLALTVLLVAIFIQQNSTTISRRINSEQLKSDQPLIQKEFEGQKILMTTSVGYRKILWEIGLKRWSERPFWGWGPGSTEMLLKQEQNPLLSQPSVTLKKGITLALSLPHLHNLYLEFLVRFGLFGALLFISVPIMMLKSVGKAQSEGRIPWDYACFLFAGWSFIAIMYFFDFQIFKYAWRNFCLIWSALTFAVQLGNLKAELNQTHST